VVFKSRLVAAVDGIVKDTPAGRFAILDNAVPRRLMEAHEHHELDLFSTLSH